ncbi:RNA polymerase sigma factor [Streptomyces sp. CAU 1734]|uniref:RNA polymerase sigma factor n=1 Tax=Streptomyces sp. CAU 1734 TaxID=3140360 RepID=UPI003260A46D
MHPRLLGYVRTLVGDPDAEDVTSEAWLQIARDLDRFSGDADRFRGWAARIARNRALDHIRMRGRRPAVGGDETELTGRPARSDTADEAMEALSTGSAMALIAQLPQDQAEAVVLRVVVGLDAKSAARTLGKRPGAVRTAAHRGLKRLAELLGPESPDRAEPAGPAGNRERMEYADGRPAPPPPYESPGRRGHGPAAPRPAGGTGAGYTPGRGGSGFGDDSPGTGYGSRSRSGYSDSAMTGYDGRARPEYTDPGTGAYGSDGPSEGGGHLGGGPAGRRADLNGLPPQRVPRPGAVAPAGVTHTRLRTQKDM